MMRNVFPYSETTMHGFLLGSVSTEDAVHSISKDIGMMKEFSYNLMNYLIKGLWKK